MAVMGSSGSGKSTFVKRLLQANKPKRLMIWDPMVEYTADVFTVCDTLGQVLEACCPKSQSRKTFRIVFRPSPSDKTRAKQFDVFCGIALAMGNLTLIVEELRFVTRPSYAPTRWAQVSMQGRHHGLSVVGTSQRPASIDKDFLGNCTRIRTGRLAYPEDVKAVAKAMQCAEADIAALKPLEWLEKDMQRGAVTRGKLIF